MMTVSIVMPETGLRAIVAMALAATEVKKNENTSVSIRASAIATATLGSSVPKKTATPTDGDRPRRCQLRHDRDVAIGALAAASRRGGTRARRSRTSAATMRSDLMMPKMPAVAIAPTPMKRT